MYMINKFQEADENQKYFIHMDGPKRHEKQPKYNKFTISRINHKNFVISWPEPFVQSVQVQKQNSPDEQTLAFLVVDIPAWCYNIDWLQKALDNKIR